MSAKPRLAAWKSAPGAVQRVLDRLTELDCQPFSARQNGSFQARCPSHREGGYHLCISGNDDALAVLTCKRDDARPCTSAEIVAFAGLAPEDVADDPRPPEFSDDALAETFTEEHADAYRYTAERGAWHRWSGSVWARDTTLQVFDHVRLSLRHIAADLVVSAGDDKKKLASARSVASTINSARTISAVEKLARADRRHAATVNQWDADPWLLNTPGGLIDLTTGAVRESRPSDYCTRATAVGLSSRPARKWTEFLERVTGGDEPLQSFLQRVIGYSLTGVTRAHAMFFLHGDGGNGKGTFVNTVSALLHDYHRTAPVDAFTASRFDRHKTELAMLQGARLVTAQETEEGRNWAEARIKSITGGDPITANFMRQDHFTYVPQFKLLIAGNHKPQLRNVDEAMRRRLHLIPFTQKIGREERVEGLDKILLEELPEILGWALTGCLAWQEEGLNPPETVRAATDDYFEEEDSTQAWLIECCDQRPGNRATAEELYQSWKNWAERAGLPPGSAKSFSAALVKRGFTRCKVGHGSSKGYAGLSLIDIFPARRNDYVA